MLTAWWDSLNGLSHAPCLRENIDMLFYVFYEYLLIHRKKRRYRISTLRCRHCTFPCIRSYYYRAFVGCVLLVAHCHGLVFIALMVIQKNAFIIISHKSQTLAFSHMLLELKQRSVYITYSTFPVWFSLGLYCRR